MFSTVWSSMNATVHEYSSTTVGCGDMPASQVPPSQMEGAPTRGLLCGGCIGPMEIRDYVRQRCGIENGISQCSDN